MKKVSGYISVRALGTYDYEFYVDDDASDEEIKEKIEKCEQLSRDHWIEDGYEECTEVKYRKRVKRRIYMNKLYDCFHPENRLKDKRLSGNSPCIDCKNMHRYTRGTSWIEEPVDEEKCNCCIKKVRYEADCMTKLQWYEDNDNKLFNSGMKSDHVYDKGIECPETLKNGCLVLYPDGWANE